MTPQDALIDILGRLAARNGEVVFVNDQELDEWPAAAVAAMKARKLLAKARPASSIVCPGCEQECVMPVHTLPRDNDTAASFIVCDKRYDINRVPVSASHLKQWRCDIDAVVGFVAECLRLHRSNQRPASSGATTIGMATGNKRSQMLSLRPEGAEWLVVAGNGSIPLAELLDYGDHGYSINASLVSQLVDSATMADPRYTPSNVKREARKLETQAMYSGWQREYRKLKRKRPRMSDVSCAMQISKMRIGEGKSPDTIRKHMKTQRER